MVLCVISFTQKKLKSVQKDPMGQETAAAEAGLDGFVYSLVSRSSHAVWPNPHHQTNVQQPIALMGPLTWEFLLHPLGITALPKFS